MKKVSLFEYCNSKSTRHEKELAMNKYSKNNSILSNNKWRIVWDDDNISFIEILNERNQVIQVLLDTLI